MKLLLAFALVLALAPAASANPATRTPTTCCSGS
jgi:hypothetical protein